MKNSSQNLPCLFIGRFQPFHFGHLDALTQVFEHENYVIIGIGSTEDDYVPENPFTAGERHQMIEAGILGKTIAGKKITRENFTIVNMRNIHHYSLWVKHVECLLPPFGRVYTGSPVVTRLFKDDGKHEVVAIRKTKLLSATEIRDRMLHNKKWEDSVPEEVAKLIKKWDGTGRIREIQ